MFHSAPLLTHFVVEYSYTLASDETREALSRSTSGSTLTRPALRSIFKVGIYSIEGHQIMTIIVEAGLSSLASRMAAMGEGFKFTRPAISDHCRPRLKLSLWCEVIPKRKAAWQSLIGTDLHVIAAFRIIYPDLFVHRAVGIRFPATVVLVLQYSEINVYIYIQIDIKIRDAYFEPAAVRNPKTEHFACIGVTTALNALVYARIHLDAI